jgi:ArsR family transcriptional regulator
MCERWRPGDPATRQSGNPAIRQSGNLAGIFVLKMERCARIDEKNGGSMYMADASVWKALSDENRRKIIELLLERDFCVRALSHRLGISEAAVSQHIKVLKQAGLIEGEKRGYYVHYTVSRAILQELGRELLALAETAQGSACPRNCGRSGSGCLAGCSRSREPGCRGRMQRINTESSGEEE